MTEGRTVEDFAKLMSEHKKSCEQFLSEFEAFVTHEQITAIVSGKGNAMQFLQHLVRLSKEYGNMDQLQLSEPQIAKYRLQASELLAKHRKLLEGLCRLCVELFKAHSEDYFESTNSSQRQSFGRQLQIVRLVSSNFHNFTDCGVEFCLALSHIEFLFSDYVKPLLTKWFDVHSTKFECRRLIMSALGFTYNMFYKNNSTIYDRLTRLQVVEPVMAYLRSSELLVQVQALLLIAFALDESKSKFYESATDVMQFLVTGLQESLDSEDRRYHGYHSIELSVCLNRLALNEVNKRLLVELGLLPVLHAMCSRGKEDEVAAALDTLFTLSFTEENRLQIQTKFSDVLQKLFASSETIGLSCGLWRNYGPMQGLDLNLGGQISVSCPSISRPMSARHHQHTPSAGQHVMISYQHEQKQLVMRIKEALVQNKISVWIDYERMKEGSTMDMMADAVEGSYAFLMCMSRTYKESNNCRLEAEYAYKNQRRVVPLLLEPKYRPNGWLGLMLGMALYHDFSGKYQFEAKVAELLEVLRKARLGQAADVEGPIGKSGQAPLTASRPPSAAPREHHFPSAFPALPSIAPVAGRVRQWTAEQVGGFRAPNPKKDRGCGK